jgi:hypothetical protein
MDRSGLSGSSYLLNIDATISFQSWFSTTEDFDLFPLPDLVEGLPEPLSSPTSSPDTLQSMSLSTDLSETQGSFNEFLWDQQFEHIFDTPNDGSTESQIPPPVS